MHDTARCFGYPSDSSRTARKRAWDAALRRESALITSSRQRAPTPPPPPPLAPRATGRGAARSGPGRPGPAGSSPPPPPLAPCAAGRGADRLGPVRPGRAGHHLRHRRRPPVRPGRCSLCSPSPGRRRALPISQWSWVSALLPVGAPDRRHASPLMSPQGAAVGRGPGWRGRGWIAISTFQRAAVPWSQAYHWHV
jgi:hypothetical protein